MKSLFLFLVLVLLTACHTPQVTRGTEDPDIDRAAITTGIDMEDWRYTISEMLKSMKDYPFFAQARVGDRKTVAVSDFMNDSPSHIETGFLRELVEEEFMKFGCFRLLEEKKRGDLLKSLMNQQVTDFFDSSTVAQMGRQLGVQYFVQGKVVGHKERGYDRIRTQYLVVIEVVDVSTAEKVFKKNVPVSKQLK